MPRSKRADDALVISDENDRILELWFSAQVSAEFSYKYNSSDFLFITSMAGQEEQKTLASALDYVEHIPESLNVCFFRQKVTLSLSVLERLVNESLVVAMYARAPQGLLEEGAPVASKPAKPVGKTKRFKKGDEIFSIENAEQVLSLTFDLVGLLTMVSARHPVRVSPDAMMQGCVIEARCGTPLLPPLKLNRLRPLKIEFRSICNLPKVGVSDDSLFLLVRFGNIEFKSPMLRVATDGKLVFRRVVFLGSGTPLSVYQDLFFKRIEVSALNGLNTCVGTGTVSLRAAATDRQTLFHEAVYLLPNRSIPPLDENCLTKGTMVSLRVDLFAPLPSPRHVLSDGRAADGQFLTRGVIIMPYAATWTATVLEVLIATLLQFKKPHPKDDVYQRVAPPSVQDVAPLKERKKDRNRHQRGHMVPPARPPSPPSPFDWPFDLVTPPGISGFEVMDDNLRIFCVEGQAVEVHRIFERVTAAAGDNPQLVILMNAEQFVPKRAYLVFPPLVTYPKATDTASLPVLEAMSAGAAAGAATTTTTTTTATTATEDKGTNKNTVSDDSEISARYNSGSLVCHADAASSSAAAAAIGGEPGTKLDLGKERDGDAGEDMSIAEAGGTGGRIHRIRIKETIKSLVSQQHYLLKKTLSEDCVNCYTKLHALCECRSLRDILMRGLFPTPEELIALERSFGLTLELSDIFGKQEYVDVGLAATGKDDVVCPVEEVKPPMSINVGALQWQDFGKIVLFEGTRNMSRRRRIPPSVQERYPHACWMRTLDTKKDVLCAFPLNCQPANTIRYRVEAQVVRCGQIMCLYALECKSLAKSCTISRNHEYEAHLVASGRRKGCQFPYGTPEGCVSALTIDSSQRDSLPLCSKSSSEDCNSIDSPPREAPGTPRLPIITTKRNFVAEGVKKIASLTKHVPRMTSADYELCWELYRRRAPVVPPEPPRGPPMHF